MSDQNKSSKFGLGMLFGIISGAVAGLLLAPKTGEKMRADVSKKAYDIRKLIEDNNIDNAVREIFDVVTEKTVGVLNSSYDLLSEKLAEVGENVSNIDKDKYTQIVSDVISTVKKDKGVAEETLVKLRKYLEDDYDKLKKTTTEPKKNSVTTKKTVKKATTKS